MKSTDFIFASMTLVLVTMIICLVGKSEAVDSYFQGEDIALASNDEKFDLYPPTVDESPLSTVLKQFEKSENERLVEELKKKEISTEFELQTGEVYIKANGEAAGWVQVDPEIAKEQSQKAEFDKLVSTRNTASKKKATYTRPVKIKTKSKYGNTAARTASSVRNRFASRHRTTSYRKPNWLQSFTRTLDISHRQNSEYSLRLKHKHNPYTQ